MEHGHILMLRMISNIENLDNKVFIEVGTTREYNLNGQDSSFIIAKFCNEKNIKFTTVDMDSENSESIRKRFLDSGIVATAVTQKGEDFLKEYEGEIDFLYLDAFDFYHPHHTDKRKSKYEDILGDSINNESCYNMHLDCCVNSIDNIKVGGYICIDDVLNNIDFAHKGKKAVPYLLKNGFKIVKYVPNCILLKKV